MVPVYEGIGCEELERNVLREFRMDEARFGVTLSYWPPTSLELATGIRTPPVLVTSDGAVKYFCQHLKVKGGMNLFARFEAKHQFVDTDVVDDSGMGFVSPDAVKFSSRSSKKGYVSSSASKTKVINLADDVDFVQEVEKVEDKLMGESHEGESCKDVADSCFSAGTESEGTLEEDLEEIEVRPRGYDEEFWKPLLAGDYGGSNAVDLVFNEDEIVEGLKKKSGPRSYFCDTGSYFDHYVEVGGQGGGETKANVMKPEDYNPWMGAGSEDAGGGNMSAQPTRKLADIDDEEFDIPPMFDDTEYNAAEIPDMDVDVKDGQIVVGKVFGSKQNCQIALAIYAIKKQFKFTQTRTKIGSFVVECPDERCDWRVTAHEIRGCGYYEIRKAQLDHICPIEFRQDYKTRATSRVIAAVYKAKFGNPEKAPVARDLQKLLLKDPRVNASYMK